jgi:hypothetical protein
MLEMVAEREASPSLPPLVSPSGNPYEDHEIWATFNIPIGEEITYKRDPNKKAKVVAPKKIVYEGETYSLQGLSNKLLSDLDNGTSSCIGAQEWLYDGQILDYRRSED